MQLIIMDELKNNPHFDRDDIVREYRDKGPRYATPGSCAMDLRACIKYEYKIWPDQRQLIPTGLRFYIGSSPVRDELQDCFDIEGIILPRSGLGSKHGIILGNGTGLVDTDYQGQVLISIWNAGEETFSIKPTDRICQFKFNLVFRPRSFDIVSEFIETTARGTDGIGSTGVS